MIIAPLGRFVKPHLGRGENFFLPSLRFLLRQLEIRLALVDGLDDLALVLELTEQCAHTLVSQLVALGDLLDDFSHRIEALLLHTLHNSGLDDLVSGLLSSQLLLAGVLIIQQLDLMIDESDQTGIRMKIGQG